jgi:DNA-binding NarL/FixJ family response regulator
MRVLIVDNAPIIGAGFKAMLSGYRSIVIDYASDAESGFALFRREMPDVAVVDATIFGASGLELARKMRREHKAAKIICLSMSDDPIIERRALEIGASAFFSKSGDPSLILDAILSADQAEGGNATTAGVQTIRAKNMTCD